MGSVPPIGVHAESSIGREYLLDRARYFATLHGVTSFPLATGLVMELERTSRPKSSVALQTSMLAITQTAAGCGIGLLLAGKLGRPTQKVTAASLFSLAALLALPALVGGALRLWNRPESARGMRRRLNSIRHDPGFSDEMNVI